MRTSNRMLTAVDVTATGVIVNKHFMNVTYSPLTTLNLLSQQYILHTKLNVTIKMEVF